MKKIIKYVLLAAAAAALIAAAVRLFMRFAEKTADLDECDGEATFI